MPEFLKDFSYSDAAQIAILYAVIYAILKGVKGSRVGQALMGGGIIVALLIVFSVLFRFAVLTRIVQFLLIYFAVSSVVIFQPEIRRILMTIGAFGFLEAPKHRDDGSATPEFIVETLVELARRKMGALIAFERGISLRSYEETGVATDAVFSRELVQAIFTPPLPLHDGGIVIRNGRIASCHCIFPVSNNPDLISHGMRHRSAVGLSEETDALVAVVSEESGAISIAHNGRLYRYTGEDRAIPILRWINKAMPEDNEKSGFWRKVSAPVFRFLRRKPKGGIA
ncbi:MAG: diadenylate cyclase [Kiritimatiellae bacterium]|nr:diadenylate cyclase [Kiritimatiellia bacterium]